MKLEEILETKLQLTPEQRNMAEGESIMNIMPITDILATGWSLAMRYVKENIDANPTR